MYEVKIYEQNSYRDRQRAANRDGAICYVEQHFNASATPSVNGTVVIVATNASAKSLAWGREYAINCSVEFGIRLFESKNRGIKIGGYSSGGIKNRGNGNLYYTSMPAILLEPMFGSNPEAAAIIKSLKGQTRLARVLVESIRHQFPEGGLVAFSIGHGRRRSNGRFDWGAAIHDAPKHSNGKRRMAEHDYARIVMMIATEMLTDIGSVPEWEEDHSDAICPLCGM